MSKANTINYIDEKTIHDFALNLLVSGGFAAEEAAQTADLLVWANLHGIDSHGVLRIPRYVEMVELGIINSKSKPNYDVNLGAISVLNADKAPGAVGMNLAVNKAIELSQNNGIGWCSAKNITHAGAIGYYAQKIAKAGKIGIVMTASKPLMTYFGSKTEGLSTNPIAISSPTRDLENPLVLDMSTASVALGKIMAAKDAGTSIPKGWGIDADGKETTDPNLVAAVLPMAGPKGSGLSFMIEILASVLVSNPIIAKSLSGDKKTGFNGLCLALDPKAFGDFDIFLDQIDELNKSIKALPLAEGSKKIYLPGEYGSDIKKDRMESGVPLTIGTINRLMKLAQSLNVSIPDNFQ